MEVTSKKGRGGDEKEEKQWTSLMKAIYLAANDSDYYRILDTAKKIMRDPVAINSTGENLTYLYQLNRCQGTNTMVYTEEAQTNSIILISSLIDIAPTLLENSYDVELVDGKIVRVDTIIRGCTLNFLNHPFNIDLMPVELGSFDVIIGMDWLRRESRLTIISCSKAHEYMAKGFQIFLAQISAKKEEDKSEGKKLKDVSIVQDFPKVFPKDLPGLPPA
ncbi:putative reverse transcriptase domain-containing protein [Tanacetum coccineum]